MFFFLRLSYVLVFLYSSDTGRANSPSWRSRLMLHLVFLFYLFIYLFICVERKRSGRISIIVFPNSLSLSLSPVEMIVFVVLSSKDECYSSTSSSKWKSSSFHILFEQFALYLFFFIFFGSLIRFSLESFLLVALLRIPSSVLSILGLFAYSVRCSRIDLDPMDSESIVSSPLAPWNVNSRYMSPLLAAYESSIEELTRRGDDLSAANFSFEQKIRELVSENEELRKHLGEAKKREFDLLQTQKNQRQRTSTLSSSSSS